MVFAQAGGGIQGHRAAFQRNSGRIRRTAEVAGIRGIYSHVAEAAPQQPGLFDPAFRETHVGVALDTALAVPDGFPVACYEKSAHDISRYFPTPLKLASILTRRRGRNVLLERFGSSEGTVPGVPEGSGILWRFAGSANQGYEAEGVRKSCATLY